MEKDGGRSIASHERAETATGAVNVPHPQGIAQSEGGSHFVVMR